MIKSGFWLIKLEKVDFTDIHGGRKASNFIAATTRNLMPNRLSIIGSSRPSISITHKLIPTRAN